MGEFDKIGESLAERIRALDAVPQIRLPDVGPNPLVVAAQSNRASEFYKRLAKLIEDFDASLDQGHEVGVRLVSFGQSIIFHLQNMGYWNPSLLFFIGVTDDGNPVQLIQHVSQISVLLMKLPRRDTSKPKQPFGFASGVDADNDDDAESSAGR
jgi:Family of unknown function (DUF6173)